jgi:amino acid permease
MVDWFYDTSIYITLPVFVGGFVIVSCAAVLALRPFVHRTVDNPKEWDHALGHVIETFGVIFGILLALVAVSVYENFGEARKATLEEAALVGALFRGTTGLPDEAGIPMRATIDEFVHTVIEQDFPAQRRGELPETSAAQVDEFEELLHDFEPEPVQQEAEFLQLLATFDDFIEARRARIDATTLELPAPFWVVLWVGAAVNAMLVALIHLKNVRLHLVLAGLLALFVGFVMFVTADMDHPYAGSISVGPGPFERVLVQTIE